MNDSKSANEVKASWLVRYGIHAVVGAGALVAGFVLATLQDEVPPGPRPDRLEIRTGGTVIIRVQPDHRGRMQGATFLTEPESAPESYASHIVVSGPIPGQAQGFAVTLPLDKTQHLDPMTVQIGRSDPHLVDLQFASDPGMPNSLYSRLLAAKQADPRTEVTVLINTWYAYRGAYDESTNDADLRIN